MESLHLEKNDVGAIYKLLTAGWKTDLYISAFEVFVFKSTFYSFHAVTVFILTNQNRQQDFFLQGGTHLIKSRRIRWAGHVAHMGEKRGVYGVLVGKPDGKRPLGRIILRWIFMEWDGGGMDLIDLA